MIVPVTPVPKPRMTQRDKWDKRPPVVRYRQYQNELKPYFQCIEIPHRFEVTFVLPMPKSWSKKKREQMKWQYHQQKPDIDNLLKGFMDALLKDDSHVAEVKVSKRWGVFGYLIFEELS